MREILAARLGENADRVCVVVRVYANILGLSRALSRSGIVGTEPRALAPFTSGFTGSEDFFDFVDAGDRKDAAYSKIRGIAHLPYSQRAAACHDCSRALLNISPETFRLFADNHQCKHIFFAGCHDVGYMSMLDPFRGKANRVTLIKAAAFQPEYGSLGLSILEIPSVFLSVQMGKRRLTSTPTKPAFMPTQPVSNPTQPASNSTLTQPASTPTKPASMPTKPASVPNKPTSSFNKSTVICSHYLKVPTATFPP